MAVALARMGVGRLVLVDFDVVEPSNLNRQQYFVDQLGQSKAVALGENLKRINPYVKTELHVERIMRRISLLSLEMWMCWWRPLIALIKRPC